MSVKQFRALLNEGKFGKNDKTWFPRWLRRYAFTVKVDQGKLSVGPAFCSPLLFVKTLPAGRG